MLYIWLLIVVLLGILEVITTNLISIWFVISGILTMIISLFTDNLYIQIGVFVIVGVKPSEESVPESSYPSGTFSSTAE